ncbi:hypothetical protein EG832_02980 [bacterium]|nr:hypothetical protein [bacterium]
MIKKTDSMQSFEWTQIRMNQAEAIAWALSDAAEFQSENGSRTENGIGEALDGLADYIKSINKSYSETLENAIKSGLFSEEDEKDSVDQTK